MQLQFEKKEYCNFILFTLLIFRYVYVAKWSWDNNMAKDTTGMCGICRNIFAFGCGECSPSDRCVISILNYYKNFIGINENCNHAYHKYCITKWLNESNVNIKRCPLCRSIWQAK